MTFGAGASEILCVWYLLNMLNNKKSDYQKIALKNKLDLDMK